MGKSKDVKKDAKKKPAKSLKEKKEAKKMKKAGKAGKLRKYNWLNLLLRLWQSSLILSAFFIRETPIPKAKLVGIGKL